MIGADAGRQMRHALARLEGPRSDAASPAQITMTAIYSTWRYMRDRRPRACRLAQNEGDRGLISSGGGWSGPAREHGHGEVMLMSDGRSV